MLNAASHILEGKNILKPTRSTIYARALNTNGKRGTQSNSAPNAECIDSFHWIKLRGATEEGEKAGLSRGRAAVGGG